MRSQLDESLAYAIEQVGSTAVPGLAAKPLIDIILVVPDLNRWPSLVEPLEALG